MVANKGGILRGLGSGLVALYRRLFGWRHALVRGQAAPYTSDQSRVRDPAETPSADEHGFDLVHNIAHELKAPLTAIVFSSELLGVLELLESDPDRHKEALIQNIAANARKVDRRITELLDYLTMKSGSIALELDTLELAPVLDDAVSQLAPALRKKAQSVEMDLPETLPAIRANRERLQLVLANLMENASEVSPEQAKIIVRARVAGRKAILEVIDCGPAMTEEETGRLFDLCYDGNGPLGRQHIAALGPGLAISKQLMELQHGELWVESEIGRGNTFAISVPEAGAPG